MKFFDPIKVQSCKNCGSPVNQYNPNSLTIICSHCGTHTANSEKVNSLVPSNPLLRLHGVFEYDSKTWQIIGCICYTGKVKEWDFDYRSWETTPWKYNSWWVINEEREIAWITHDSSGYKWARKSSLKGGLPENDLSYEQGSWRIVSAAGEFSYFPRVAGQSMTYEKKQESIEIQLDDNGNKKEIEAFRSTSIELLDLLNIFNKTDALKGLKRFKLARKAILSSLFCLLIGYFILTIRNETLLPINGVLVTQANDPISLGSINIDNKSLVQFNLRARISTTDGRFNGSLVIKDAKNAVFKEIPLKFRRSSGNDSSGSWVETAKVVSPRLKLPKNTYQLFLNNKSLSGWKNITISGKVEKNIASLFPLIMGAIVLVFMLIILGRSERNFIRKSTGMKG